MTTLFCLPFAGGNKYSFRLFEKYAPPELQLVTIELPGRGSRTAEPLLTKVNDMVEDLYQQIKGQLKTPFAFYGHSMGALLVAELAKKVVQSDHQLPVALYVSGAPGPSRYKKRSKQYLLPKPDFLEVIRSLGGIPDELAADERLMDYYEPIFRADFRAIETHTENNTFSLPVPIYVMTGTNELINEEDILSWKAETSQIVQFRKFPGGHFFIYNHAEAIVDIIRQTLASAKEGAAVSKL